MPKGKKFNAAEKHFEQKCVEWRKQIREVESKNKELWKRISDVCDENEKLKIENERLKQQNETLMALKDMSKEDVRTLIRSKESVNKLSGMFDAVSRMF